MNGWYRVWDADRASRLHYGRKQVTQDLEGGCARSPADADQHCKILNRAFQAGR